MSDRPQDQTKTALELLASGAKLVPNAAQIVPCSTFRLSVAPIECLIQLGRMRPFAISVGDGIGQGEQIEGIQTEPVATLSCSPQALKDLGILIADEIANYEATWGPIETEFTRSRRKG